MSTHNKKWKLESSTSFNIQMSTPSHKKMAAYIISRFPRVSCKTIAPAYCKIVQIYKSTAQGLGWGGGILYKIRHNNSDGEMTSSKYYINHIVQPLFNRNMKLPEDTK